MQNKDIYKSHLWQVYAYSRDKYLTEFLINWFWATSVLQIVLLNKGSLWLYQQYLKGKLPMKKDWTVN